MVRCIEDNSLWPVAYPDRVVRPLDDLGNWRAVPEAGHITSTCLSLATFSSGLCFFWGMPSSSKWLENHTLGKTLFQGASQFDIAAAVPRILPQISFCTWRVGKAFHFLVSSQVDPTNFKLRRFVSEPSSQNVGRHFDVLGFP